MFNSNQLSSLVQKVIGGAAGRRKRMQEDRRLRAEFEQLEGRILFSQVWIYGGTVGGIPFYCAVGQAESSYCSCPPQMIASAPQTPDARAAGVLDWAAAAKLAGVSSNPVRYFDGQPDVTGTDLTSHGFGREFAQQRT